MDIHMIYLMYPDPEILYKIVTEYMPFGRYRDTVISNLPVSYLEWFSRQGFPEGKIGMILSTIYEIKINGLEYILDPIKAAVKIN